MAASFVQSASNNTGAASASTIAATFTNPTAAGTTILLGVSWGQTAAQTITGIADTNGNTWPAVLVSIPDAGNTQPSAFYALAGAKGTGSANTITVTFSGSVSFRSLIIGEYWGSVDQSVGNLVTTNAGVTDFCTSTAKTTVMWGETVVGFHVNTSTSVAFTIGTGFTSRQNQGAVGTSMLLQDLQQTVPASRAATATVPGSGSGHASNCMITLSGQAKPNSGRTDRIFNQTITRSSYW